MKEIKLQIDGQEIIVHVDESELARLIKPERTRARTGYERVKFGEHYYTSAHEPCHSPQVEERDLSARNVLFERGDYVNDEQLFYDRDRARVLHDRMEQWQALNDKPVDWGNNNKPKFEIKFDYQQNKLKVDCEYVCRSVDAVYFSTYKKAEEAIDVFRDELMWYYTEYRSRLDEPERKTK